MQHYESLAANSMAFRRPTQQCEFLHTFHPIPREQHMLFPGRNPDRFDKLARCSPVNTSQYQKQGEDDKFRQLPCRTFVASGACPYRDRCVYLHDPRIATKGAKSKTRKKNKEELHNTDSFFWPIMQNPSPKGGVMQHYTFPRDMRLIDEFCTTSILHDEAVFSMWNHFVAFCESSDNVACVAPSNPSMPKRHDVTYLRNQCTGRPRLPVFIVLSNGASFAQKSTSSLVIASSSSIDEEDVPSFSTTLIMEAPVTPPRDIFPVRTQMLYQEKHREVCSPVSIITSADTPPSRSSFKKTALSLDSRVTHHSPYTPLDFTYQGVINPFVLANMKAAMYY